MELQQSNGAPINWYGAQRARQLRSRCIGTVRSRTQSPINQSINQSVSQSEYLTFRSCSGDVLTEVLMSPQVPSLLSNRHDVLCFLSRSLMAVFLRLGNLHSRSCKGKLVCLRTMRAYGRVKGQLRIFLTSPLDEVNGERNVSAALSRGTSCGYPLNLRLDGLQIPSGWESDHDCSDVHPVAQSLCRLSSLAHSQVCAVK